MDECFLLSSTKDLTPVAAIDDVVFKVGEPSVTLRLKAAFAECVKRYVAGHPELRLFHL